MSYRVKKYQETPNPNAIKCVLDRKAGEGMRSYFSAQAAAADPLGSALFKVDGVTNVLIGGEWITVSKRSDAGWREVKAGVERALREAL
jgi:hypothetical protein